MYYVHRIRMYDYILINVYNYNQKLFSIMYFRFMMFMS